MMGMLAQLIPALRLKVVYTQALFATVHLGRFVRIPTLPANILEPEVVLPGFVEVIRIWIQIVRLAVTVPLGYVVRNQFRARRL